ncbi:tyrosine-protein phosphatase non-receptor type 61F isoform X2 [Nilaparvata lugens]|uniref:tyrosine-protein phosphatase non-receptor type 61F isoform X2 n=1 Tax=Nilaparvata lugens TaxID=108931 RepID=UPI00193D3E49|nr:tyrosine-protein phosphatase non-receptor type 61F isoform X2 [Nilaparvata lugens]
MNLESKIRNQFENTEASNAWPVLIQDIKKECSKYDFTVVEAKKMVNKYLNRYRDVIPYDHTRIVLSKGGCDYINANIVKVEKADRHYILTQGPLPHTTSHFWLMVWEQNCKAVIMLNKVIEKNMIKCHQYWPEGSRNGGDDVMLLADVGLKVELISETDCSYYITRKLRLTDVECGESREIVHFQYTTWPDYGIPQSPTAFLHFLGDIRRSGALGSDVGPAIVHCSAGIGRSGSFCLVDSCLVIIKDKQDSCEGITIRDILMEMRKYRMGLVQTAEQLRFCYLAIIEGLKDNFENSELPINEIEINNHEEEPPPLPPPRSESLPPLPPLPQPPPDDDDDDDDEEDDDDVDDDDDESPSPSSSDSGLDREPENGPKSPTSEGLRQRMKEKQQRTADKVAEMKRKQKEAEDWAQLKRRRVDEAEHQPTKDNVISHQ